MQQPHTTFLNSLRNYVILFLKLINIVFLLSIDPSPEVLNSLPVYFRVKPTLRTPSGRRCRKSRTVFSDMQLKVLEKTFAEQRYLDTTSRSKLAQNLGLNETQVKTWFQNRRMKWKKESKTSEKDDTGTTKAEEEEKQRQDGHKKRDGDLVM